MTFLSNLRNVKFMMKVDGKSLRFSIQTLVIQIFLYNEGKDSYGRDDEKSPDFPGFLEEQKY